MTDQIRDNDITNSIIMSSDTWVYGFTQIDNGVIDHADLNIYDKMVYVVIKRMVNQQNHITFPSYQTIAEMAGCSRRKAIDTIKRLQDFDLIRNMGKHAKYGSNLYVIKRIQESSVLADPEKNLAFVEKEIGKQKPPKPPKKQKPPADPGDAGKKVDSIPYKEIITYLNEKAKRKFLHTTEKECREFIRGRWNALIKAGMNDQQALDEFRYVIDTKVAHWFGTEKAFQLRPSTLFRDSKFDKYRNESPDVKPYMGQPSQGVQSVENKYSRFLSEE